MNSHAIETFHLIVEWAALGIEILAVAVIVCGVVILGVQRGTIRYLFRLGKPGAYESYKHQLGRYCYWEWNCWLRRMWSEP